MRIRKRAGASRMLVATGVVMLACGDGQAERPTARDAALPAATSEAKAPMDNADGGTVAGERGTVLFLGTSLTAGLGLDPDSAYPQRIQRRIDARRLPYEIVNAGVSGETAAGLRQRLDWVLQRPARVIVVETGANDGLRGQSVDGTRATIREILTRIRTAQPQAVVVLAQMEAPPNLGASYTAAYRAMFPSLAREMEVTLMPFLLEGVAGEAAFNQADGVHPNSEGARRVADNVWRSLEPLLTEARP